MTLLEVPALILLTIFLFLVLIIVAAAFAFKAFQDKAAKDVANQPEDVKEHAKEGLDSPEEEEAVDDPKA